MKYVRVYADPSGESHVEDVEVPFSPLDDARPIPPIHVSAFTPAAQVAFLRCPPGWHGARHPAHCRQFLFHLAGEMEVEVSDGEVRRRGPGSITLLEATSGKGQAARVVGPEEVLLAIIELPD